ncbi:MAG: PaaX family transcriptional regulator [Streptosporangiaceae bacterium]
MPGYAIEDALAFPGSRPHYLLITLLGDYWFRRDESIGDVALAGLLAEFGVPMSSAEAAVSRMTRQGMLEALPDGAAARYRTTSAGLKIISEGAGRIFTFGVRPPAWDGTWTRVSFSVPESMSHIRNPLIRRLRWLGFAPLRSDWYAPGDRAAAAVRALSELSVTAASISTGAVGERGDGNPIRAWDLDVLRTRYQAFISRFGPVLERARGEGISGAEALVTRTATIDIWRSFLSFDPGLPAELLPPGWPLTEAAELFHATYDLLGPCALSRVRQVLDEHDSAAAELAVIYTSQEFAHQPAAG